jgi:hypothetical protein
MIPLPLFGATSTQSPLLGDDHIHLVTTALRTTSRSRQLRTDVFRAVCSHLGRIGFDLVAASLAHRIS